MTLPEFSVQTNFKGTSGKGELKSKETISCSSDTSSTSMEANKHLGTYAITFSGCTALAGIVKCQSLGDAAGTILTDGSWHLVLETLGGVDKHLILFLLKHLHIECATVLVLVLGTLLGELKPLGVKTKNFEIKIEAPNSKQEFTSYENEGGTLVAAGLRVATNEGTEEAGIEISKENKMEGTAETEVIN